MSERSPRRLRRRWLIAIGAGVALVVVLAVGGPFVYIHFIQGPAPQPLSLPAAGAQARPSLAGTYAVTSGSVAGYRVSEHILGQQNTAVGRTSSMQGQVVISGSTVTSAHFTVDMAAVRSDESLRDEQFRGRIMDTARYPSATFQLTRPIQIGSVPSIGTVRSLGATGELTLRGQTHVVTIPLRAERVDGGIDVLGSTTVVFADWGIPNPSNAVTTTASSGTLEFLLVLSRTASTAPSTTSTTPGSGSSGFTPISPTTVPPLHIGSSPSSAP